MEETEGDIIYLVCLWLRLEADGQFERAASIAVFNMKIGRAIEVLHKGSKYYQGMSEQWT